MKPPLTFVGAAVVCLFGHGSALAAGFDCRPYYQSRTCPEIVVCDTPKLSELDDQLSGAYDVLMKRLPASQAASLRNAQRAWVGARKQCGCDAGCILRLYERRIQELDEFDDATPAQAEDFVARYACNSTDSSPGGPSKRYALEVKEKQKGDGSFAGGTIFIRGYDWPDEKAEFSITREVLRFQIKRVSENCAKYGWEATNGKLRAVVCTATQGVADVSIFESDTENLLVEAECDRADVE